MENLIEVSLLRKQLSNRTSGIGSKCGGVYCWWFKRKVAEVLLEKLPLTPEELAKIQEREIKGEGESYLALYFGISKNMLARAKWHILQKHSPSAVMHGTLSTLRQTLSALLGEEMSKSQDTVNEFIDINCYWEWEYDERYKQRETYELSSTTKCYPLNIQENQTVNKEVCKKLSELRKQHKK